jgi:hypothetical protein
MNENHFRLENEECMKLSCQIIIQTQIE